MMMMKPPPPQLRVLLLRRRCSATYHQLHQRYHYYLSYHHHCFVNQSPSVSVVSSFSTTTTSTTATATTTAVTIFSTGSNTGKSSCYRYLSTSTSTPPPPSPVVVEEAQLLPSYLQYGSLHDDMMVGGKTSGSHHHPTATATATTDDNTSSLINHLITEQSNTIQRVVPWFLHNMPKSYFQQIPIMFQLQHIKAITAITDANMELYINLQAHNQNESGGSISNNSQRHVYTFIRPSTKPGTLLQIVQQELPFLNHAGTSNTGSSASVSPATSSQLQLSRIHFFSTRDASLSLNMFIYGPPQIVYTKISNNNQVLQQQSNNCNSSSATGANNNTAISPEEYVRQLGKPILDFAAKQRQQMHNKSGQAENVLWEDEDYLIRYMLHHCTETYIRIGNTNPIRFLHQMQLVQSVSNNDDGTAIEITPVLNNTSDGNSTHDHHDDDIMSELSKQQQQQPRQNYFWVDVAVSNSISQVVLQNLCHLLYIHNFDIVRARLDVIPPIQSNINCSSSSCDDSDPTINNNMNTNYNNNDGMITLLRTLVTPIDLQKNGSDNDDRMGIEMKQQSLQSTLDTLVHEMKRSKWIDPMTHELVYEKHHPFLNVTRGEIIIALCHVIHPILSKFNSIAYSITNIYTIISNPRFIPYASDIANVFLNRFNPNGPLSDTEFQVQCDAITTTIDRNVEDTMAITILQKMIYMVKHILKTNVYMPDRYALSFRFNPAAFTNHNDVPNTSATPLEEASMATRTMPTTTEQPYGVIFVHGRRFNGYHVRFRDIARGGLRLVTPSTPEQYALESARQYDECYGLAYAQQLKNKDIPEGGSKAVALIQTYGLSDTAKALVMRKAVKAMTDAILDLIVETDYTNQYMVDLWGQKEVIYLGPDEQVLPEDIEWIVKRAAERGYDTPAAFMSSKPRAGINHKVYGVTSEGVNVYLDVALRTIFNIDPMKDVFTVKMTGGPDGDVAGNEINILIREYGTNVKIVGIADHSGCVEDPIHGLDHSELLRLFHASLNIAHYDPSKLSIDGAKHTVDTPDGVKARNSMHNRLEADIFLPCGGRPNTIDITNYKQFLTKSDDGYTTKPSSKLIVEGANLFITSEARKALFDDAGVIIVKDSSANKGGVITSSYEICAAMLLSEKEFFDHKEQIVQEVLDKLRGLAKLEADLLFREFENDYDGLSLPEVSQIISNCINTTTDALRIALDNLPVNEERNKDLLLPLFRSHLPKTIAVMASDRIESKIPDQYIKNAIASCLASKIVYKEGTKFIASLPPKRLANIALDYIQSEKEISVLLESLYVSNMEMNEKWMVQRLLENGGARTALKLLQQPTTKK